MDQAFSISIPTPCHEDFSKMTPDEKGRFCQSCQKSVIDFSKTTRTDFEQTVLASKGELCGRVPVQWLFQPKPTLRMRGRTWARLRTFVIALLAVFGPELIGISGLTKAAVKEEILHFYEVSHLPENGLEKIIAGTVLDQTDGEPVLGAEVKLWVNDSLLGREWTDSLGNYEFRLSAEKLEGAAVKLEVNWLDHSTVFTEHIATGHPVTLRIDTEIHMEAINIHVPYDWDNKLMVMGGIGYTITVHKAITLENKPYFEWHQSRGENNPLSRSSDLGK